MKIIANNYTPGEITKIIREWCELTQKEFGKSINKSQETIKSYELDRINMPINTFMEIAKKHNIIITIEKK